MDTDNNSDGLNIISRERLETITYLCNKYNEIYLNMNTNKYSGKLKERMLDEIVKIYIPNVLRDLPAILNKIESQKSYIQHVEEQKNEYEKRYRKAYKKLKWKVSEYYDFGEPERE